MPRRSRGEVNPAWPKVVEVRLARIACEARLLCPLRGLRRRARGAAGGRPGSFSLAAGRLRRLRTRARAYLPPRPVENVSLHGCPCAPRNTLPRSTIALGSRSTWPFTPWSRPRTRGPPRGAIRVVVPRACACADRLTSGCVSTMRRAFRARRRQFALTLFAVVHFGHGEIAASALLFPFFVWWCIVIARWLQQQGA